MPRVKSSPVRVRLASPADKPLKARVSFQQNQADLTLENIHVTEPANLEIPSIQARLVLSDGGMSASGSFAYVLRILPGLPFSMESPAQAAVAFSATRSNNGAVDFSIKNNPPQKDIVLIHEASIAYLSQPVWNIYGAGPSFSNLDVDFFLSLPVINIETGSAQAPHSRLGLHGQGHNN